LLLLELKMRVYYRTRKELLLLLLAHLYLLLELLPKARHRKRKQLLLLLPVPQ
jgi:hypothetical protein